MNCNLEIHEEFENIMEKFYVSIMARLIDRK